MYKLALFQMKGYQGYSYNKMTHGTHMSVHTRYIPVPAIALLKYLSFPGVKFGNIQGKLFLALQRESSPCILHQKWHGQLSALSRRGKMS